MTDAKALLPATGASPGAAPRHPPPRHPAWLPGDSAQYVATVVLNMVSFSFGCVCGWPSVAGPQLLALGASEEAVSWVAAVVAPASIAGALILAPLTERLGRRLAALAATVPLVLGWAALALLELWVDLHAPAPAAAATAATAANMTVPAANADLTAADGMGLTMAAVLLARSLQGVSMGGVLIVCPMYIGEVVEDRLRGQLGSYMGFFIASGILYVYAMGAQMGFGALAFACGVIPVAFLAALPLLPETPTFLLSRGDEGGALASLAWLRDPRRPAQDLDVELSVLRASLKGQAEGQDAGGAGFRDLVGTRSARRAVVIVLGLLALQQLSGITAILNNANTIFAMAGSSLAPEMASVVVAAVQMVGAVASCVLADRLGRLPLLYASYGGMTVALAVLGACFAWPALLPAWVPVACLSAYILVYALASGPAPFVLLVEVFPAHLRAVASQICLPFLCILSFIVAKFYTDMVEALTTAGCFWLFCACSAAAVVFVRLVIPETRGRAVDDIVAELEGRGRARADKASQMEMA